MWRRAFLAFGLVLCWRTTVVAAELTADDAVRLALRANLASAGAHGAPEANAPTAMTQLVEDARGAWFRAIAARQAQAVLSDVRETLDLAAEFATSLRAAGNLSALDLMRHQALQAETAAAFALLRTDLQLEQERLAYLVGMGPEQLSLPAALAEVPASPAPAPATADMTPDTRWSVRTAYLRYVAAHERALTYRDKIVPLRRAITEETMLRFNGMLVDVFALLTDARERSTAKLAAIEAQRDFWLAENALRFAEVIDHEPHEAPALTPALPDGGNGGGH